ncbi:hypothetical protein DFJ58DRAFT_95094 [Suillus subalutaceus]|uniref:uncharacterized protein n=1 Tax=Suillus subalutaceus TaxID=48586 RepID=UPI001B867E9D|nr:uncharacterized protein DFJ58DRAFT_95094 [Suillus subalutaceus]KAG1840056.1 hypothetical protein DFJ58DRAFT_95094 [Suillus subalutaceus]
MSSPPSSQRIHQGWDPQRSLRPRSQHRFIGHHLDQKRLHAPLYRHPADDIFIDNIADLSQPRSTNQVQSILHRASKTQIKLWAFASTGVPSRTRMQSSIWPHPPRCTSSIASLLFSLVLYHGIERSTIIVLN